MAEQGSLMTSPGVKETRRSITHQNIEESLWKAQSIEGHGYEAWQTEVSLCCMILLAILWVEPAQDLAKDERQLCVLIQLTNMEASYVIQAKCKRCAGPRTSQHKSQTVSVFASSMFTGLLNHFPLCGEAILQIPATFYKLNLFQKLDKTLDTCCLSTL